MKNIILKKRAAALLCLLFCLSGCRSSDPPEPTESIEPIETPETVEPIETEAETETEETKTGEVTYLSLGDSIARGYGLSDLSSTRYSAKLCERYTDAGSSWTEYNVGVDGQTSTELVSYVNTPSVSKKIEKADLITISIGANNILGPASSYLAVYRDFIVNPNTVYTDADIAAAYETLSSEVDSGIETLDKDIPTLIESIRSKNETCEIVFLTVYNPYAAVDFTMNINDFPIDFATLADSYVTRLSEMIENHASDCGYLVADVHSAFEGNEANLVNTGAVSEEEIATAGMDPHPNAKGHNVIAKTIYEVLEENEIFSTASE